MKRRLPDWLKVRLPGGEQYKKVKEIVESSSLNTVCQSAACPNIAECWGCGTATFMILGNSCSRNCSYCNINHSKPGKLDQEEPNNVAKAVQKLNLKYAVITSVTRDDLDDGGASVFFETVNKIKKLGAKVELLIPDFKGKIESIKKVVSSNPYVIAHNIEVVKQLFAKLRPNGDYQLSLDLLKNIKKINPKTITKSGFMLGFGETKDQIIETLKDLKESNVDIITIGQYLQPSKNNTEVKKFYTPEEFNQLKQAALKMGFKHVESGPLVRSSYHAANQPQSI